MHFGGIRDVRIWSTNDKGKLGGAMIAIQGGYDQETPTDRAREQLCLQEATFWW